MTKSQFGDEDNLHNINPTTRFDVTFDPTGGIYVLSGDFDVQIATHFPLELESCLNEYIDLLWEDMTQLPEDNLDPNLHNTRANMRQRISKVSHAQ